MRGCGLARTFSGCITLPTAIWLLSLIAQNYACFSENKETKRIPRSVHQYYESNSTIQEIATEINNWMEQQDQNETNMPVALKSLMYTLNYYGYKEEEGFADRIFSKSISFCGPCKIMANIVIGYSRIGASIDILANFLVKICYIFVYKSTEVCKGIIHQDAKRLNYIIRNSKINGRALCSLVLGSQGCGPFKGPEWFVHIPPLRPTPTKEGFLPHNVALSQKKRNPYFELEQRHLQNSRDRRGQRTRNGNFKHATRGAKDWYRRDNGKRVLKVLHLTDPHFDPDYLEGTNAVCEAPLCCNPSSGRVSKPTERAGKWGDYRNCDAPKRLIENMFEHIKKEHPDLDYIYMTGDVVPHHIWKASKDSNTRIIRQTDDLMEKYFRTVPIYGSIGNHESYPRDSFPPPEENQVFRKYGNQWLYDVISDSWRRLAKRPIPSTAKFGGYYSILIRPKFRLISLNTNFCYILNWWVLYKSLDPGHVLSWLVGELEKAELRGEHVHIIGHIPPLYVDCYDQWRHQYSRIISRYSHIIKGQFYGHSHLDEFRVHYDVKNPNIAVGVEYITPNNGPYNKLNPSYRIFYVDGEHAQTTREVLDYETYVMNLSHANQYDDPKWYKLYSAKKDLNLPNLQPSSWNNLVHRLDKDKSLFAKYYRYQMQDSTLSLLKVCDADCRRKTICNLVEGDVYLPKKCRNKK